MVRAILLSTAAWAASLVGVGSAFADDAATPHQVTIATVNGRKLTGVVDSRTDDQRLWLRQADDNIVLASSVAWSDVATATFNGEEVDADSLRRQRGGLATSQPRLKFGEGASGSTTTTLPVDPPPRSNMRMRNLAIVDSCLVNLDRDVEPDGLQVAIAAIGDDGQPMPASGSMTAELFGERRPWRVSDVSYGALDRWSKPVRSADFVDGVATYVLPFRHAAPEWQFDVLPDAILTVRLGAYGQGAFAASSPVVIRPLNPMRDNRQLLDKTRFMPGELHGRNPHNRLSPDNGLWLHWTR